MSTAQQHTLYPIYISYLTTWALTFHFCSKCPAENSEGILWTCETLWAKPESFSSPFFRVYQNECHFNTLTFWKRPLVLHLVPEAAAPQALAQPAVWDWEEELWVSCLPSAQLPLEDSPAGDRLQFREPLGLWGLSDFHSLRETG